MRIAIGQLSQESNTLSPLATTRADFEDFGVFRGDQVVESMAETNELGGFIQSLRGWPERPEIVGLARLAGWSSGTATAETFDWLRDELLGALERALPVDGLLLSLHGAMAAEDHPDVAGDILLAIRRLAPAIPIVATLDLHANITSAMAAGADALVLFHTAPHIDIFETGQRGARVLRRILVEQARPVTAFQKLPLVVPAERANTQAPGNFSCEIRQRLEALEQQPGILAAGLATVQPWLDVPNLGTSVVVVCDDAAGHALAEQALAECGALAEQVWRRRRDYLPELVPLAEAVRQTHAEKNGLVVLSDSADATTSGAPGDSTWLVSELLRYDWPRGALVTVVAPEVVSAARAAGEGAKLRTPLGGRRDHRFSQPIEVDATIVRLFDARFILSGHAGKNLPIDMGPSVVLRQGDVRMVITSRSGPHFAPDLFRLAGFDPFAANVLVAKSPCGFRAAYADRATKIMVVQAPGCAPSDFWNYEFNRIERPMWPWDEIADWRPAPKLFRRD
jgi:microcystin degradation protein MlrC